MLVFDIETGPLPDEQLQTLLPALDESSIEGLVTGEFDPESVKCGNLKDPAKIAAKIEEARADWDRQKARGPEIIEQAKQKHWREFVERAPLSAVTGRVLAIGYLDTEFANDPLDEPWWIEDCEGDEAKMLSEFWETYLYSRTIGRKMVGHNSNSFDVPFLMRRSWILGVEVPSAVLDKAKWLDPTFVDTMALWGCGNREPVKLDVLGQAFGVGRKTDGVQGGDFHKLWFGSADDRAKAVEYLIQDLQLTAAVASKMCLI